MNTENTGSILNLDTVLDGVNDDHSETVDFTREPMPEGWAFARIVEYVELGTHPQVFQGKPTDPAMEVQFGFEVTPVSWDKPEPRPIDIMRITIKKKKNDKAAFTKLFMAMRDGRQDITHSVDFIKRGDIFFIMVKHSESKSKPGVVYANLDKSQVRRAIDVVSQNKYAMPAYPDGYQAAPYRVFLWDTPRQDMWESLYIDGDYEKEVDGAKVKVSKNFIQEKCLKALNFKGSPLNHLLLSLYGAQGAPDTAVPEQVATEVQQVAQPAQQSAQPTQPTQPVQAPQQVANTAPVQAATEQQPQPAQPVSTVQTTDAMLAELGIKL